MIEDITYCMSDCKRTDCFRNKKNIRDKSGMHSFMKLAGTEDCLKTQVKNQICNALEVISEMAKTTKKREKQ